MSASSEPEQQRAWPTRLLGGAISVFCARPRLMLWLMLMLGCMAVGYSVSFLEFRAGRTAATRSRLPLLQKLIAPTEQRAIETFGNERDALVVVRTDAPNGVLIRTIIDQLGAQLIRDTTHFENVLARVDLAAMKQKALQFLSPEEIRRTESKLNSYDKVVREQNWKLIQADQLTASLTQQIARQQNSGHVKDVTWESTDRLASSLASWMRHSVEGDSAQGSGFRSPLPDLLTVAADQKLTDGSVAYMINDLETVGVVQVGLRIDETATGSESAALTALQKLISETRESGRWPDTTSVAVTGIPAIEHEELRGTWLDMGRAAVLAVVLLAVVLLPVFRGGRHPMLALMTLLLALCFTAGAATVLVGQLTLISSCSVIFVVGMCIDFSISFINRYFALRNELYEIPDALREVAETTGGEIQVSALTTALAFATTLLSGFPELAELGVLSGVGVLISAASVLLFLPALIAVSDAESEDIPAAISAFPERLIPWLTWRPVIQIPIAMLLLGAAAVFAMRSESGSWQPSVTYNSSLIDLLDPTAESVVAERILETAGTETVLHAVSVADSWEEAVQRRDELLRLPSVARVSDAASKLPDPPDPQVRALLQRVQQRAAGIPRTFPQLPQADFQAAGRQAEILYGICRESDHPLARSAAASLDQFLTDLTTLTGQQAEAAIGSWNTMVARWLLLEYAEIASANRFDAVGLEDLPIELHGRYLQIDADGRQKWALRVYPEKNIWDRESLEQFIGDLRSVDPLVAGEPVEMLDSVGRLHLRSAETGMYALAVISLMLLFTFLRRGQKLMTILPPVGVAGFIGYTLFQRTGAVQPWLVVSICLALAGFLAAVLDYRNLRDTLLTLVPAFGGGIVLLGVMAVCGFEFNPMNLIALPMVFAIGVDNGIYLVRDCRNQIADEVEEYAPSQESLSSSLITSLTSIAVFGSLMISSHQGLFSMGVLLTIGVLSSLAVSLTLMPSLMVLVARHQPALMAPVHIIRSELSEDSAGRETADEETKNERQAA